MPPTQSPVVPAPRRMSRRLLVYGVLALSAAGAVYAVAAFIRRPIPPPPGMVPIPAGEFAMGSTGGRRDEQPVHRVRLAAFYMDEHEVTNAQFSQFVEATGHVTVAERPVDWGEMRKTQPPGTPRPPDAALAPSSLVFVRPDGDVDLNDYHLWWRVMPGADWRHPEGPKSNLNGREHHPVVHVGYDDAAAYAKWAGKRLPTEAEWEYAARGGLVGKRFIWGDDAPTDADGARANVWQGKFPKENAKADGYDRTAPVKSYPPNGYGLYDMPGNAWEWCADWYRFDAYENAPAVNPRGPADSLDPREPLVPKRVMRGGSYLCHVSYCESYRPAARMGSDVAGSACHVGFRCVHSVGDE